jgi:hypothetical protein
MVIGAGNEVGRHAESQRAGYLTESARVRIIWVLDASVADVADENFPVRPLAVAHLAAAWYRGGSSAAQNAAAQKKASSDHVPGHGHTTIRSRPGGACMANTTGSSR